MTASLARVLERLRGVRRSGMCWISRCPSHSDKTPSLSIREDNRRILLHCFAGCSVEAICAAAGINIRDLFTESRTAREPEPLIVRKAEKQIASPRSQVNRRDREPDITGVLARPRN